MSIAILTADIFGILILCVLFYSFISNITNKSQKNNMFLLLLTSIFIATITNAFAYFSVIKFNINKMTHLLMQTSFVILLFVTTFYLLYLYLYYKDKITIKPILFRIGLIYICIGIFISIILSFLNVLVVYKDGNYNLGKFYTFYVVFYFIIILYIIFIILYYSKSIGIKDTIATILFLVFPIIAIIINLIYNKAFFCVSSLSISVLTIYISLQQETNDKLDRLYKQDKLTGLFNRNAYMDRLNNMPNLSNTVGIIYSDLNCLKYTNDNFGHDMGDKLLIDFSNILLKYFRKDDVFRISGDEFVCICPFIPIEIYTLKTNKIKEEIQNMELPIAAIGNAYGNTEDLSDLINEAEKLMYKDKQQFHNKYPNYSRQLNTK